jgi:hypothetical protein
LQCLVIWLNGKGIHSSDVGGAAVPGEHKIDVVLNEGWNVLLKSRQQRVRPSP